MIEFKKSASDDYRFVLKSESGSALLNSVAYANLGTAEEAANALQALEKNQRAIERKTDHNGKFLFSLKNNDGMLIGNSQLYGSEAGMENGIKNLINRIRSLSALNQL